MNSKSSQDFRWSVKLAAGSWANIGIASNLQREKNSIIASQDANAIVHNPFYGLIVAEKKSIQSNLIKAKPGDEIDFRFQPKLKKFSISFVCSINFSRF